MFVFSWIAEILLLNCVDCLLQCRLRISLAVADSPIACSWDDRTEYGQYIEKVSHVAARCRLSAEDELLMSQRCQLLATKASVVRRVALRQFNRYQLRRSARIIQGHQVGDAQDRQRINAMLTMVGDAVWAEVIFFCVLVLFSCFFVLFLNLSSQNTNKYINKNSAKIILIVKNLLVWL